MRQDQQNHATAECAFGEQGDDIRLALVLEIVEVVEVLEVLKTVAPRLHISTRRWPLRYSRAPQATPAPEVSGCA